MGWNIQDGPVTGLAVDAARRFGAQLRLLWPPCGLSVWLGLLTAWWLGTESEMQKREGPTREEAGG